MRFRRQQFLVGGILLIAVVVLAGGRRMPTGPDGAAPSAGPPQQPTAELRVGIFNIHGAKGTDNRRDSARLAQCVEGLTIVGLNEVRGSVWSKPSSQTGQIAAIANFHCHVDAPAETRWFGTTRFGNGLLSNLPVVSWQRIPLPRGEARSCRNMLLATIRCGSGNVRVLVTHLVRSHDRERTAQLEAVLRQFAAIESPAILLADLNTPPGDARIERFLNESGAVDAISAGNAANPAHRVDWILVRGLECLEAERIETEASDHPLFTARLTWPGKGFSSGDLGPNPALPE